MSWNVNGLCSQRIWFEWMFYQQLVSILLSLKDYHLVIGGDFNAVQNPLLDRSQISHSDQTSSKLLKDFIKQVNVCDIWWLRNEAVKDYTFFSARHKSFSCIDYLLISPAFITFVEIADILPLLLSDHSPVTLYLLPFSISSGN